MSCEVCQPVERGYTVYFSENQSAKDLVQYFQHSPETSWKSVNDRMFWVKEPIFFDLMDYIEAHLDKDNVFAVLSRVSDPFRNLNDLKKIDEFKKEREASWIDTLIDQSSICTHYQPIVRVENDGIHIVGQELLSRGIDKTGSIIPPFKMFEAARIRNRVFSLDRACRMQAVKNASLVADKLIFINFIPTAIYVPEHCLSTTFELIKKLNIKPEQVVFEVVETDDVEDIEHLKSILNYYRSHGFKYALDDVGTGYNNLKKLSQMEPDFVKLAFEYTNGISTDLTKQTVAKSVLSIARELNSIALAEGVENEEDLNFLVEMGYDLFQGYYFAKPGEKPLETIERKHSVKI